LPDDDSSARIPDLERPERTLGFFVDTKERMGMLALNARWSDWILVLDDGAKAYPIKR
jgi:hypothetical protein